MPRRRMTGRDPLEGETFIDISSHSSPGLSGEGPGRSRERPPRRPPREAPGRGSPARRPAPDRRPPRNRPPARGGPPEDHGRPRGRPSRQGPPPRRRNRKPMSKGARRLTLALALLAMATVTGLLCVFLLFKISSIQVTGDQVYDQADILALCDYSIGDNLVFVSTWDREERLESQLPYVEKAEIIRHLPGTLEIRITAAQTAMCVESGGLWLCVSSQGKILEQRTEPVEGVLQVAGLASANTQPGQFVQTEDDQVQGAYEEIVKSLEELGMLADCTRLDLTDLYNIRLWYQGRVECKLGSTADLGYKLSFAWDVLADPDSTKRVGDQETGVLDLSYAADTHQAGFTAGQLEESSSSSQSQEGESQSPQGGDASGSEEGSGSESSAPEGWDSDIPTTPFTG